MQMISSEPHTTSEILDPPVYDLNCRHKICKIILIVHL